MPIPPGQKEKGPGGITTGVPELSAGAAVKKICHGSAIGDNVGPTGASSAEADYAIRRSSIASVFQSIPIPGASGATAWPSRTSISLRVTDLS
jgi:hypothetical protein